MLAHIQSHIFQNLELELLIQVNNQNVSDHGTCLPFRPKDSEMREVKNLAASLRGTIQQMRAAHAAAINKFDSTVKNSNANLQKVQTFTQELHEANLEVEQILGETGSNFPEPEAPQGVSEAPKPDRNGVTVNKG